MSLKISQGVLRNTVNASKLVYLVQKFANVLDVNNENPSFRVNEDNNNFVNTFVIGESKFIFEALIKF